MVSIDPDNQKAAVNIVRQPLFFVQPGFTKRFPPQIRNRSRKKLESRAAGRLRMASRMCKGSGFGAGS